MPDEMPLFVRQAVDDLALIVATSGAAAAAAVALAVAGGIRCRLGGRYGSSTTSR